MPAQNQFNWQAYLADHPYLYEDIQNSGSDISPQQYAWLHYSAAETRAGRDPLTSANYGPNHNVSTGTGDNNPFIEAPRPAVGGGNYNQVQNAVQGGQFSTTGQNTQSQQGTSGQETMQDSWGQTVQTGTQQTQQAGTTSQQGTSTESTAGTTTDTTSGTKISEAIDTLGFGQLLKDQAASAAATDAQRNAWLQDVIATGGSGFLSQLDQGIRQSQSGPMMTGAGESARARMAAYAASEIGRNNLNQRLAASQQLAGPTAVTNLATAANPFIGRQDSSTGTSTSNTNQTTTGTQNTSGTSASTSNTSSQSFTDQLQSLTGSMTGWQNLLSQGTEAQSGTTTAQSSQAGAGNIPQGQPVKTGGCVLCTAAIELGLERNLRVLRKVIAYKLGPGWKSFRLAARGYFAIFGPFADYLLDHPKLARLLYPLAKKVVYEELRVSGRSLPFRLDCWLTHWLGDVACRVVGLLPVSGQVNQPRIIDIARRNNILFQVQS